jgi:hypothetical protein
MKFFVFSRKIKSIWNKFHFHYFCTKQKTWPWCCTVRMTAFTATRFVFLFSVFCNSLYHFFYLFQFCKHDLPDFIPHAKKLPLKSLKNPRVIISVYMKSYFHGVTKLDDLLVKLFFNFYPQSKKPFNSFKWMVFL